MDAVVQLKQSPREFDLTREALDFYAKTLLEDSRDRNRALSPAERHEQKAKSLEITTMLARF